MRLPHPRIVLITGTGQAGGSETMTVALAEELHRQGAEAAVFFMARGGELTTRLDAAQIPWWSPRFDPNGPWAATVATKRMVKSLELARALRRFRPDVVQVVGTGGIGYGLSIARRAVPRAARVGAIHGLLASESVGVGPRRLGSLFTEVGARTRREMPHTDAITVVGPAVLAEALRLGAPADRIHVIGNAIPRQLRLADVAQQPPTAVVVAGFRPVKGHDLLLEALALLTRPVRIRLVGEGLLRDGIREQVQFLGLDGAVSFAPTPADVPDELSRAQFAIQPSRFEALPLAVMEARSAGLPVVATAVGGLPDLVHHERNGLLVPPGDAVALAAAIDRLSGDPALRTRLGAAARQVPPGWRLETYAGAHLRLYRDAMASRERQQQRARRRVEPHRTALMPRNHPRTVPAGAVPAGAVRNPAEPLWADSVNAVARLSPADYGCDPSVSGLAGEAATTDERSAPRSVVAGHALIVCTRNRGSDLAQMLASLLGCADLPQWLIVVDSSDDDDSAEGCEAAFPRLSECGLSASYHRSAPGLTHQRNVGLSLLPDGADVVHFIDDDCRPATGYFRAIERTYRDFPAAAGVGAVVAPLPPPNPTPKQVVAALVRRFFLSAAAAGTVNRAAVSARQLRPSGEVREVSWLSGCAMSFRAAWLRDEGFDEDWFSGYSACEDLEVSLRMQRRGPLLLAADIDLLHLSATQERLTRRAVVQQIAVNRHHLVRGFPERFTPAAYWWSMTGQILESAIRFDRDTLAGLVHAARAVIGPIRAGERRHVVGRPGGS